MSALERLKGIIGSEPAFKGLAESVLKEHAHELGEKLRSKCHCWRECGCCGCLISPKDAAKAIDPEFPEF